MGSPYHVTSFERPLVPLRQDRHGESAPLNGRIGGVFALGNEGRPVLVSFATLPNVGGGLIGVFVGPENQVLQGPAVAHYRWQQFHLLAGLAIGLSGLMALLVWVIRRQDRQTLWFGLCCLTWALRAQVLQVFSIPINALAFEQLNPLMMVLAATLIGASTLWSLSAMTRGKSMFLLLVSSVASLGYLVSIIVPTLALPYRTLSFATSFAMLCWMVWLLGSRLAQLPSVHAFWLSLGYSAVMIGASHDLAMIVGLLAPGWWTLLTPGFAVLLLCHLISGGLYLLENLHRAERANEALEHTIQTKTAQLEASYAQLRGSEREAARTQEREHLLREMHDGLGAQLMTALRGVERGAMPREQILQALQDSLDDLRLLMDSTDMGRELTGALVTWRSRWSPRLTALGLTMHWQLDEALESVAIPPDTVLQVMRILQEAAVNTVKHSQATAVRVSAVWVSGSDSLTGGEFQLTVQDNGVGLPPDNMPTHSGGTVRSGARGLVNMATRARKIRAELQVIARTTPERGTQVQLRLPIRLAS